MSQSTRTEADQRKQHLAGVFDRAAPTYDQVGPRFFQQLGQRAVELAQIAPGAKVLDVATGRGAMLFAAAKASGPQGQVIGVDLSETMVQATGLALTEHRQRTATIEVRQMDAEHLQFPDATFDYVLCGFAVFFFPQLAQALAEFRRVLRPGGRLCVTTWTKDMSDQWAWFDELSKAYLPPEPATTTELTDVFDTPAGMEAILQRAGFSHIQVFSENADFVYPTPEDLWNTLWSHGMRARLERIEHHAGAEGLQRFKADLFKGLATMQQPDGIHQALPTLVTIGTKPADEPRQT